MVKASGLESRVPHAPLPADNSGGAWVDFGNRESGQTDKANNRGDGILGIGQTCERWQQDAKKKIEKKPLLKRIFG